MAVARGGPLEISLGGAEAQPMREPHTVVLGSDVGAGSSRRCWCRLVSGRPPVPWATEAVLVTCIVAPGFDFADFRLADG